jgi:hypothetical protein
MTRLSKTKLRIKRKQEEKDKLVKYFNLFFECRKQVFEILEVAQTNKQPKEIHATLYESIQAATFLLDIAHASSFLHRETCFCRVDGYTFIKISGRNLADLCSQCCNEITEKRQVLKDVLKIHQDTISAS